MNAGTTDIEIQVGLSPGQRTISRLLHALHVEKLAGLAAAEPGNVTPLLSPLRTPRDGAGASLDVPGTRLA